MKGENYMDQIKIGKFISSKRKEKKLTQSELSERLGITDRAISKWENGICLPDAGTMPKLCEILGITINDLFSGEKVDMENYNEKMEQNLLETQKQKEEADKKLLGLELIMGTVTVVMYLLLVMITSIVEMQDWIRILIIVSSTILLLIVCFTLLRIEQTAGYYECAKCHHKHVPTYPNVLWAMHIGRTRYMKCPECKKCNWQRKVIKKD